MRSHLTSDANNQTTSLDVSTKARSSDAAIPESSLPPDGGIEVLHLGDLRCHDHPDDHLCDVAAGLHRVEEHSAHWAALVSVDHPCVHVGKVKTCYYANIISSTKSYITIHKTH